MPYIFKPAPKFNLIKGVIQSFMKKNFKILLVTLFVLFRPFALTAQPIAVVPYPASVILSGGQTFLSNRFTFNKNTNPRVKDITHHFEEEIKKQIGGFNNPGTNIINIEIIEDKALKAEMYRLTILKNKVEIRGQEAGIFYAFQTLTQLILASRDNRNPIPLMVITDSPRFVYRGMHLDVGRHFFPPSYIKKYIDYLAAHKMNTFHWHLTEDQGWRLQIKKYPKLTEVGSCRAQTLSGRFGSDKYDSTRYCGFYTQQEIKDIVQYAKERYITVIPEIDIPGHSLSALAAYPFLGCTKGPYKVFETWGVQNDVMCAGNDSTYTFIENVLDEVMEMFPSKYIHIGGDEAPKERWKECPVCQQKIKNEHLKDEHELQSYFIHRVEKYVNSKGRNVIGWDEILEGGLAPNATVMSWRGMAGGIAAAKQHHKVIMTPETPLYLNFSQTKNEDSITQGGYNPLEAVYAYEPIPASLGADSVFILGAQGNMWTEYASNIRKVEYLLFPRMSALSEVLWSPKSQRNWASFEKRIPALFNLYRLWNANYSTAYYDIQPEVVPFEKGIAWKLQSKNKNGKIIYVHGPERNATFDYTSPLPITKTINMGAALTAPDHTFLSSWTWQ
ncbi:MAG: beta-N-acetylhexosaminidase, partial [Ferruginibacter sp.]